MKTLIILILSLYSFSLFSQSDAQLKRMWDESVKKAEAYYKLYQSRPLFEIAPSNPQLKVSCKREWGCSGGNKNWFKRGKNKKGLFKKGIRVAVLTWIDKDAPFYDDYVGNKKIYTTGDRITWVTAVPEIKLFCTKIRNKNKVKLRLEQYLGIPFNGNKGKFVTIWVKPGSLFRPCLDAEIYDGKCKKKYRNKTEAGHKEWIEFQANMSFPKKGGGYPWTRRGFAYDWGSKNYQGASEYILKKGSSVYIHSIDSTEKYCGIK